LNSKRGNVPELREGDEVEVVDWDGTVLLEGTLVEP
jgi:hypothetical protein